MFGVAKQLKDKVAALEGENANLKYDMETQKRKIDELEGENKKLKATVKKLRFYLYLILIVALIGFMYFFQEQA